MENDVTPKRGMTPTQTKHPWRATARTAAAYLFSGIIVLSLALPIISEELAPYIPERVLLVFTVVTGVTAGLASAITRIMALPAVDHFLSVIGLSSQPESE